MDQQPASSANIQPLQPDTRLLPERKYNPINNGFTDKEISVTIATFNCLASALCTPDSFPHADPRCLPWEYRKKMIVAEILNARPDVIALQEVDKFSDILLELNRHTRLYTGVWVPKQSGDGLAVLYDHKNFSLIGFEPMFIDEDPNTCRAIVCRFKRMGPNSDEVFRVVNLHLKAKPEFEIVRNREIRNVIINLPENTKGDHSRDNIFIVGDFNAPPSSETIRSMYAQTFKEAHQGAGDCNMYAPGATTSAKFRETKKSMVSDYIFYSPNSFDPVAYYSRFDPEKLCPNLLPCIEYPSDHILIACKFVRKNGQKHH